MSGNKKFQNKYRIPSARWAQWDYGSNATYFITICTQGRLHYFGEIVETQNVASLQSPNQPETQNVASLQSPNQPETQNTMNLSELGIQAQKCAIDIPLHFTFVTMDTFIVMPNHVHLLFTICKPDEQLNGENNGENGNDGTYGSDGSNGSNGSNDSNDSNDSYGSYDLYGSNDSNDSNDSYGANDSYGSYVETQNFASLQPITDQPITDQPITDQPITDQPITDQPITNQPITNQPITDQPITNQPRTEQPTTQPMNQFGPQSKNVASIVRGFKIGVTNFARENNIEFQWQARFHDHVVRNEEGYYRIRNYINDNVNRWDEDTFNNAK